MKKIIDVHEAHILDFEQGKIKEAKFFAYSITECGNDTDFSSNFWKII
jgi:hypothetical protein